MGLRPGARAPLYPRVSGHPPDPRYGCAGGVAVA